MSNFIVICSALITTFPGLLDFSGKDSVDEWLSVIWLDVSNISLLNV